MKIILPCAGFGTRVGMKPNESKELLLYEGKPIIEWCLELFPNENYILVVREEKEDLLRYAQDHKLQVEIVKQTKEWPESVYSSRQHWDDTNLLLLPDTRFKPKNSVHLVDNLLKKHEIVAGTHLVDDASKWGILCSNSLCEKPNNTFSGVAWGYLGFRKDVGNKLFLNFLEKGKWFVYNSVYQIELDEFKDITR